MIDLKKCRVMIGTPMHDHRCNASYMKSVLALYLSGCVEELQWKKVGGCGVARARTIIANQFLQSNCTHLFFIDGDIEFEVGDFTRILGYDLPVVGGMYFTKGVKNQVCAEALDGGSGVTKLDGGCVISVKNVGTGFLCIKRKVIEDIAINGIVSSYIEDMEEGYGDKRFAFFIEGPVNGRWLSEDWYFNYCVQCCGYGVHLDVHRHVQHEGMIKLPIMELLNLDKSTKDGIITK